MRVQANLDSSMGKSVTSRDCHQAPHWTPTTFATPAFFFRGQLDLNDLFNALAPSFTGTPTNSPLIPYSPSRYTAQAEFSFWSLRIASTISTAARRRVVRRAGLQQVSPISAPPFARALTMASMRSFGKRSGRGIPAPVESRQPAPCRLHDRRAQRSARFPR